MKETFKCLPGSSLTPKTSVLIHILLWCVIGKNRKYFAKTPSTRICLISEFLSSFALNNCKKPHRIRKNIISCLRTFALTWENKQTNQQQQQKIATIFSQGGEEAACTKFEHFQLKTQWDTTSMWGQNTNWKIHCTFRIGLLWFLFSK